ncbi:MAG: hypothetical protein IJ347_04505 [Faecalibacterium sp.]|nr:hypothetical protein [Faecalibacterium sp.]
MKNLLRLTGLLLMFLAVVFSVNYAVDPANLMHAEYEQTLAEILASGQNAANVDNMDDRRFVKLYAEQRTQPVDTLVLGSSRSLQITAQVTGVQNTVTAGVTGSDLRDVISNYFLFEQAGFSPSEVVLSLDFWYLSEGNLDGRANVEGYEAFCGQIGSKPLKTGSGRLAQLKNFFSFSYFQSSVDYLLKNGFVKAMPTATDQEWAKGAIKRADGSYGYAEGYRTRSQKAVDEAAAMVRIADTLAAGFSGVNPALCTQLEAFVQYLQQKGIQVRLLLSPVHPDYYAYMQQRPQQYAQVFESERFYRQMAQRLGLAVYGCYDPAALGAENVDFYDELHPREAALLRYYNQIVE